PAPPSKPSKLGGERKRVLLMAHSIHRRLHRADHGCFRAAIFPSSSSRCAVSPVAQPPLGLSRDDARGSLGEKAGAAPGGAPGNGLMAALASARWPFPTE